MDSPFKALRYIFVFAPIKLFLKVVRASGAVYGILEYDFQIGKRKAKEIYDKLSSV